MRTQREQWDQNELVVWDEAINKSIWELIEEKKVKVLHTFLPMGKEVNVWPTIESALKSGIQVITTKTLPKGKLQHLELHDPAQLADGLFGTKHPAHTQEYEGTYDLIVVPGLAFDRSGGRIGYGAGYYDQFLCDHTNAIKIAVCYPFQLVDHVPQEGHDLPMTRVIFE